MSSERVSQTWPSRAFASASSWSISARSRVGRVAPALGHAARGREHAVERLARGLEPAAVALDLREQRAPPRARVGLIALQAAQRAQTRLQIAALDVGARGEHGGEIAVVVVARARAGRQRLTQVRGRPSGSRGPRADTRSAPGAGRVAIGEPGVALAGRPRSRPRSAGARRATSTSRAIPSVPAGARSHALRFRPRYAAP